MRKHDDDSGMIAMLLCVIGLMFLLTSSPPKPSNTPPTTQPVTQTATP